MLGGLAAFGGFGLAGCVSNTAVAPATLVPGRGDPGLTLAPLRASAGRIFDVSVCIRPFRPAGPRLDTENVGDAMVVHNYGHGGSGWSLSWGSSAIAVRRALANSPREIAVIGSGPLGLTSALLAQSAGAQVTIYAREIVPEMPSLRATGSFTPDSRIALTDKVDPSFPDEWEQMARTSFRRYNELLGLPGDPVQWIDRYSVSEPGVPVARPPAPTLPREDLDFVNYGARVRDLFSRAERMPPGTTPFHGFTVVRRSTLMFNLAAYANLLVSQFRQAGGRIERREFHALGEFAALPEKVVINCSGYGARALVGDQTMVPVRGQIAWLIPQREFDYGVSYRDVNVIPRTDGIAVQAVSGGDMRGYGDDNTAPDRAEAEDAVSTVADLYSRFGRT